MQSIRAFPAPVWVLFAGMFVNKFGTFVVPFFTLYLTGKGYSLSDAGITLAAYGVGNFIASGYGGYLADRIGRRKTIVLSMAGGAACMLSLAAADTFITLVVLAAFAGFTAELYRPAASALVIDLVPSEHRVTAFAVYRLCFNAGWAFGPAAAGLLAKHSYLYLFIGEALTCAIFGVIAWFFLPRGVLASPASYGWGAAFHAIRNDRVFLLMLSTYLAIGFVFFQMMSSYGAFTKSLGFDERIYGFLLALNGVIIVLFELPLTVVTRKLHPARVLAVGYGLVGIGAFLTMFATTIPGLAACCVIFTLGEIISMPIAVAYVSQLAPDDMRGRYMGAVGLTWATGLTLAPMIGLRLLEADAAFLWGVCGALGLAAALVALRLPK